MVLTLSFVMSLMQTTYRDFTTFTIYSPLSKNAVVVRCAVRLLSTSGADLR